MESHQPEVGLDHRAQLKSALVSLGVPSHFTHCSVHIGPDSFGSFGSRARIPQIQILNRVDSLLGTTDTMLICSTPTDLLAQMQTWAVVRRNYLARKKIVIFNLAEHSPVKRVDMDVKMLVVYGAPTWDREFIRDAKTIFYQNQHVFRVLAVGGYDPLYFSNAICNMSFNYMIYYNLGIAGPDPAAL